MTTRNILSESSDIVVRGTFTTSDSVTISLFSGEAGTTVSLSSAACVEAGTTGIFSWSFTNLTTAPIIFTDFLWVMSNGSTTVSGAERFGGFVDTIDANTGTNVVTLTIEETDTTAISGVQVQLFDSTQTTVLDTKTTDTAGQVIFSADDATYVIILNKSQTTFTVPESLVVSGTTAATFNGEPLTISEPAGASQCIVSLFSSAQDPGSFLTSLTGTATIVSLPTLISDEYFPSTKITGTYTSADGQLQWTLPRTAVVLFVIETLGISEQLTIPDSATVNFQDIS